MPLPGELGRWSARFHSEQRFKWTRCLFGVALTAGVVAHIEICRINGTTMPIPFLPPYMSIVLSANLNLIAGLVSAGIGSLFVVWAAHVGFGPPTLTDEFFQVTCCSHFAGEGQLTRLSPGEYVCVRVADTGPGISDDVLVRMFEPFYTTKATRGGTGLGLSMVQHFLEQSSGQIQVGSRIGKGTTLSLYLLKISIAPASVGNWSNEVDLQSVPVFIRR